ncbi:cupredoxin domain-containing protein [Streptomyces sp. NPDC046324]|uniref:cupredoxin domain-containing protein n=1 Tax=Streptomyces sp. NPDC046324 TaxID=3154915 RepID=UPI0033EB05A2
MTVADVIVIVVAVGLIAVLGWYFFGPRKAGTVRVEGGVQRVDVTVRGGYSPNLIKVRQGTPVELVFDRQEAGECTSRVVFPDLKVGAGLPAHTRTTVRLSPDRPGTYGFACGMNMIHGTLVVEPADGRAPEPGVAPGGEAAPSAGETSAEDAEAADIAERQAEIKDLTRRVVVGAGLTAPVLFAVMAHELFGADGCPAGC